VKHGVSLEKKPPVTTPEPLNHVPFKRKSVHVVTVYPPEKIHISHLGKAGKSSAKCHFWIFLGDMLVPWRMFIY